jgi:thiol-disulfide isomerase/thioredoxin
MHHQAKTMSAFRPPTPPRPPSSRIDPAPSRPGGARPLAQSHRLCVSLRVASALCLALASALAWAVAARAEDGSGARACTASLDREEQATAPAPSATPHGAPQKSTSAVAGAAVVRARDARDVALVDLDGIKAELRQRHGRPVILHFWASWCGPCLMELPLVNQLAERLRALGADVVSISLDDPAARAGHVLDVLRERAPSLTAAVARIDDPDRFMAAFQGIKGQPWEGTIPALFAFNRRGALARQHLGEASAADLAALAKGAGVGADAGRPLRGGRSSRGRRSPSQAAASPATK